MGIPALNTIGRDATGAPVLLGGGAAAAAVPALGVLGPVGVLAGAAVPALAQGALGASSTPDLLAPTQGDNISGVSAGGFGLTRFLAASPVGGPVVIVGGLVAAVALVVVLSGGRQRRRGRKRGKKSSKT